MEDILASARLIVTKIQYSDLYFFFTALMTHLYYEIGTPEKLTKKVDTELKYVKRWLDANKLSLNNKKTNYVIFHSPATTLLYRNSLAILTADYALPDVMRLRI